MKFFNSKNLAVTAKAFLREEDGATMIEYSLLAGLVSVAAITILTTVGTDVKNIFTSVETALGGAVPKT